MQRFDLKTEMKLGRAERRMQCGHGCFSFHWSAKKEGNELRLICGSTICEFAGSLAGEGTGDPKAPVNRAVADLQAKPLNDDLAKLGLERLSGSFTGAEGKPERLVFMLYYSRVK